eukprot:TRINITY_DN21178_c0_g1_i3.p1 TRINITY_DN21178_c0_g1~~TRINITY_DN21178_c0_g1_i3.p1  ORF type:complete len:136 (+),score=34.18 TRINITY_DN21178_c0_g1_i3:196-603(+)
MGGASTIGKHVRHALEHYVALADALMRPGLPVRYDDYKLKAKLEPVALQPKKALDVIGQIVGLLEDAAELSGPEERAEMFGNRIRVVMLTASRHVSMESTMKRELHFVFHHAVHHDSAMRTIASQLGLKLSLIHI